MERRKRMTSSQRGCRQGNAKQQKRISARACESVSTPSSANNAFRPASEIFISFIALPRHHNRPASLPKYSTDDAHEKRKCLLEPAAKVGSPSLRPLRPSV